MNKNQKNMAQRQEIIQLVQELQADRKRIMNASRYEKLTEGKTHPSLDDIKMTFGSFSNLLLEAGIISEDTYDAHGMWRLNRATSPRRKWTVRESMTIARHLNGPVLSTSDYMRLRQEHPEMLSRATIVKRCGSWSTALREHGLVPGTGFTDVECLRFLRFAMNELGTRMNSVAYDQWAIENGAPRLLALTKRFGSWPDTISRVRD